MSGAFPAGARWALPAFLLGGVVAVTLLGRSGRQFVTYPRAAVAGVRDVHDYQGGPLCQGCHPKRDARLDGDPVALCTRCHAGGHPNHSVGGVQKAPPGVPLPLLAGDRLACHTCHDPHDLRRVPGGLRHPPAVLCTACHPGY